MIDATGSAVTALKAFQKKLDVTANNIANVNTDHFKKSRAILSEGENGGVQADVDQVGSPVDPNQAPGNGEPVEAESSNVDLVEEFTEMIKSETAYRANAKTIHSQEKMLGSLLDMFS
jgi:flagellar hook protein FlgE